MFDSGMCPHCLLPLNTTGHQFCGRLPVVPVKVDVCLMCKRPLTDHCDCDLRCPVCGRLRADCIDPHRHRELIENLAGR